MTGWRMTARSALRAILRGDGASTAGGERSSASAGRERRDDDRRTQGRRQRARGSVRAGSLSDGEEHDNDRRVEFPPARPFHVGREECDGVPWRAEEC